MSTGGRRLLSLVLLSIAALPDGVFMTNVKATLFTKQH